MKLIEFTENFPDEASCKQYFKEVRLKEGVICPKCGGTHHYWKNDKSVFECKNCGRRTSLKSGTVMHKSKLPFRYWFLAIHLITSVKKTFSAKEIQRQLGHNRYQPIWHMMHKIREAMGKRDDLYKLVGQMELDHGFISTHTKSEDKGVNLKRGSGSQKKSKVLIMVESEDVEKQKKGMQFKRVGYLKMKVVADLTSDTVKNIVIQGISENANVVSDDSKSFVKVKDVVNSHEANVVATEDINKVLPWVHIAISNAKRWFLNTYHIMKPEYLQKYLNEYCYDFNRRFFGDAVFDRLLVACATHKNTFRYI